MAGGLGAALLIVLAVAAWQDKSIDIPLISERHKAQADQALIKQKPTDVNGCLAAWNAQPTEEQGEATTTAAATIFSYQEYLEGDPNALEARIALYEGPKVEIGLGGGYVQEVVAGECLVLLPTTKIMLGYPAFENEWATLEGDGAAPLFSFVSDPYSSSPATIVKNGNLRLLGPRY